MYEKLKNIILICSDAGMLTVQKDLLQQVRPDVAVADIVDEHELEKQLGDTLPDLIVVVRIDNGVGTGNNFLDVIRKNEKLDDIPVYVYTIAPGKKDLSDLLKKWRKDLSFL